MHKYSLSVVLYIVLLSSLLGQNQKHIVKKGENVYRISLKYGVSMASIFEANPGSKNLIRTGQVLTIPTDGSTTSMSAKSSSNYLVKKGETKFGLSQKFGVSIAQLESDNPQIVNGLQAGHLLKIPEGSVTNTVSNQGSTAAGNTHRMQKGETFWSVSKKYNTTVQELLDLNSGIDINDLSIGQMINIPSENSVASTASSDYIVVKGDTKYSLSKRFNLSITELEALNPEIKDGLKPGQRLEIASNPNSMTQVTKKAEPAVKEDIKTTEVAAAVIEPESEKEELTEVVEEVSPEVKNVETATNSSWYDSADLNKTQRVTWLIPYDKTSFKQSLNLGSSAEKSELTSHAERYKGSQKAIEDLKAKGFDIEINDIYNSDMNLSDKLDANLIISTLSANQKQRISVNNETDGIYLNLNNSTQNKNIKSHSTLNPLGSLELRTATLVNYIDSKKGNLVVIDDQNIKSDNRIIMDLKPDTKMIQTEDNDTFQESELLSALTSNRPNIVLIKSDKASVFLNTTNALLRQFSKYDLQIAVLDKSQIPSGVYISSKRFRILRLLFPSVSKINTESDLPYSENPSEEYLQGYDSTIDAILRLSQSDPLNEVINRSNRSLNAMDFDYQGGTNGWIVNSSVFLYQYGKDAGFIKLK